VKIAVIGTGYVGLVAGTCLADSGNEVVCVDIDQAKIDSLIEGKIPIFEPGLDQLVMRNMRENRLSFTTDITGAVRRAQFVFIAVGTPSDEDGSADLSHVLAVARSIGEAMQDYKVVVIKSTVPVGTNKLVQQEIDSVTDLPFDVVSNPEFLKEGAAINDFFKPDRVVIGSRSDKATELMQELYAPFVRTNNPIIIMDPESAEMTKYASNAMLATKISFINEIANLCDIVGADVDIVRKGIGFDQRIGFSFLFPGVGFGGSCFPKDVRALVKIGAEHDYNMAMLKAVEEVNEQQKSLLAKKVFAKFGNDLTGRKLAIWGLSFKPRTDDIREAPSLVIIEKLKECGAELSVYDPEATANVREVFGDSINYCDAPYDVLQDADALLIVTEWNEFRRPDFDRIKDLLAQPIIFDGRNLYEPKRMRERGFIYYAIGRKS
jgi:UDPglucose 6-dehydrogenase